MNTKLSGHVEAAHRACWTSPPTWLFALVFFVIFPMLNCKTLSLILQLLLNNISFCHSNLVSVSAVEQSWRRAKRVKSPEGPAFRVTPREPGSVSCCCRPWRWVLLPPFHVFCPPLLWNPVTELSKAWNVMYQSYFSAFKLSCSPYTH